MATGWSARPGKPGQTRPQGREGGRRSALSGAASREGGRSPGLLYIASPFPGAVLAVAASVVSTAASARSGTLNPREAGVEHGLLGGGLGLSPGWVREGARPGFGGAVPPLPEQRTGQGACGGRAWRQA